MIVKNEEEVIERCLKSMSLIEDEIIITDTGSTDHTKEICLKYTEKNYDFEWIISLPPEILLSVLQQWIIFFGWIQTTSFR
jgi:glycosyltransferase involved in cell wall biosynthesis